MESKESKNYIKIMTAEELISQSVFLAKQLHTTEKYVYHYTYLDAIEGILESGKWYFGSPENMNDGMEAEMIKYSGIKNLFFGSFLLEETENIAMWSMYSQPWEKGVMVKIPVEFMKNWVNSNPKIWSCTKKDKKPLSEITDKVSVSLHKVAYSNSLLTDYEPSQEVIQLGNNKYFCKNALKTSSLAGYIKNNAWSYEQEVRLRVSIDSNQTYEGILIKMPEELIDNIRLVSGPLFKSNLVTEIRKNGMPLFNGKHYEPSSFTGLLNWVYCNSCPYHPDNKKTDNKQQ